VQAVRLLPLAAGNLLPYSLLATTAVAISEMAGQRFGGAAVAAGAAIAASPYAVWLARTTFSGPQAQAMALRPLLVVAAAAVVAAGFAAALWFASRRNAARSRRGLVIALLVAAALAPLVASRTVLPGEYAPLHQALAIAALLVAALAGRELASAIGSRRLAPAIALGAAVWAAAAGVILAHAHGDAWLLWSETGGSRYLTRRWSFAAPEPELTGTAMIVRPDLASPAATALRAQRAAAPAPDIILFSIDGLRRDRVGAYGYERRALTPTIDGFAARGVRFTRAVSSFPTTQVFNTALLLGRYVDRSGRVQQPPGFRAESMPRLLHRRDYLVFVKGWFDQRLKDAFDPAPWGIDTYAPKATHSDELEEPMEEGLARVAAHLAEARRLGRPALVWVHLLATHPMTGQGFRPHPDFDFGDAPMDRYESAVAGSDRWLAGLEALVAQSSGRPTIWILFSDHGVHESTRSRDLREPLIRVPLVVVAPGIAPRVDDRLVDVSLDLAATVVDLAGIAPPADYDGVSLAPILADLPAAPMEARLVPLSYAGTWTGAMHGRHKVLRQQGVMSLYDLVADPNERHNLIAEDAGRAYAMMAVVDGELARRFRAAAEARQEGP
jgi:arylsulfatase A-like enzyme